MYRSTYFRVHVQALGPVVFLVDSLFHLSHYSGTFSRLYYCRAAAATYAYTTAAALNVVVIVVIVVIVVVVVVVVVVVFITTAVIAASTTSLDFICAAIMICLLHYRR